MRYLVLLFLLLTSCARHVRVVAPNAMIERDRWSAREDKNGVLFVYAADARGEQEALAYLCPKNAYVCEFAPAGRIIRIERMRK
jgi:hypothetical protein